MVLIEDFIRTGRRNRPGRPNPCNFITIHTTGNRNATADALAHARYLHGDTAANIPVSWHYTTDNLRAVQHLPDNEDAFHAGDGSGPGNRQSIGIEICVNNRNWFRDACVLTANLTAELLNRHNLTINDIRQHHDWSRKNCPAELRSGEWGITWDDFLNMVSSHLESEDKQMRINSVSDAPEWARPFLQNLVSRNILRGDEQGRLNVTEDMIRGWMINERMMLDMLRTNGVLR